MDKMISELRREMDIKPVKTINSLKKNYMRPTLDVGVPARRPKTPPSLRTRVEMPIPVDQRPQIVSAVGKVLVGAK